MSADDGIPPDVPLYPAVHKLVDCLIAAVAIRNDVPVLHQDADFDVLARCTTLRVA